jgi:tetraacyldisaccharide 4'-kinase
MVLDSHFYTRKFLFTFSAHLYTALKVILRVFLFPFALIYGSILSIRNLFFDVGLFSSYRSPLKTIGIGNLSVGGTGKTPMLVYIHSILKEKEVSVATLSRGYGRNTKGFFIASNSSTSAEIGDEPLQLFQELGNDTTVTVCEKRVVGLKEIAKIVTDDAVVLLDDAFQHRWVTPGLSFVLTTFQDPFFQDFVLPAGRLREFRSGVKRASAIVVTKCDLNLAQDIKKDVLSKLVKYKLPVFFSSIVYGKLEKISDVEVNHPTHILLVSAIANAGSLIRKLEEKAMVTHLKFADHHAFTEKDLLQIYQKYSTFAEKTILVCTQKDAVKLKEAPLNELLKNYPWYCQYIAIEIDKEQEFKKLIYDYVDKV